MPRNLFALEFFHSPTVIPDLASRSEFIPSLLQHKGHDTGRPNPHARRNVASKHMILRNLKSKFFRNRTLPPKIR